MSAPIRKSPTDPLPGEVAMIAGIEYRINNFPKDSTPKSFVLPLTEFLFFICPFLVFKAQS
jgi:hypothetical protein